MSDVGNPEGRSPERRALLLGAKLRALVGDHTGRPVDREPEGLGLGVGLVLDGTAWVLVDGAAARSLGPALVWAMRRGAGSLHLIAETDTGLLARRAAAFAPPIAVWCPDGRDLVPAVADPLPDPPSPPDAHLALVGLIEEAGATPNVELGVVTGEVRGLEVCRVVDHPTTGRLLEMTDEGLVPARPAAPVPDGAGGVLLEVGVGANDREAFQLVHGDVPKVEALADVVRAVVRHRSAGAPQHPLNRMARERFLRWRVAEDPSLVGLAQVVPAAPPVARPSMKEPAPCVGIGRRDDGAEVVAVFSTGVDLDVVPYTVDAIAAVASGHAGAERSAMIVLPSRDLVPATRDLAGALRSPVELRTVD